MSNYFHDKKMLPERISWVPLRIFLEVETKIEFSFLMEMKS